MGIKQKIIDIYTGFTNYASKEKLPEFIKEQVLYRMELCKDCANSSHCTHCGCISPVLFFSSTKTDALGKWGPMVSEEEWNKYKETDEYKEYLKIKEDDTIGQSDTGSRDEGDSGSIEQSEGNAIP